MFTPARLERLPASLRLDSNLRPLIYACHAAHGALGRLDPVERAAARIAYAHTFNENTRRLAALERLTRSLSPAGPRVVLLKGAALVRTHYLDPGVRPMADIDLACAPVDLDGLVELFERQGLRARVPSAMKRRLGATHDVQLHGPELLLELHFRAWHELGLHGRLSGLLARAEPIGEETQRAWVPAAADHLCHVLVHAAMHAFGRGLAWLTDAVLLVAAAREGVWTEALLRAEEAGAEVPFQIAAEVLRRSFPSFVPDALMRGRSLRPVMYRAGSSLRLPSWCDHVHSLGMRALLLRDPSTAARWAGQKVLVFASGSREPWDFSQAGER